jgi:tetratricopeptide (TPR) repeat protein
MPELPSGKSIVLVSQISLLNSIESSPGPGLFWVDSPAENLEIGQSLGIKDESIFLREVPLPESLEEFKQYITVAVSDDADGLEKSRFNLSGFPPAGFLSDDDAQAWRTWLDSQPVQLLLEMRRLECFDQVEYFDRLKILGMAFPSENPSEPRGGFDLFLEREPVEDKKQRHARFLHRAEGYLSRLKIMQVKDPQAQITWVDLLMEEFSYLKAWREGELFFESQFADNPGHIEFHVALLKCMFEQGKYKEVEDDLWKAVAQSPQRTEYWNLLIQIFLNQQSYIKALEIINVALSINPENKALLDNKFLCETTLRRL